MKRYQSILFIIVFSFGVIHSQTNSCVQITGGIIMPMSSSKGFNGSVQYNISLSKDIQLYIYSGYSAWDTFNATFIENWSTIQRQTTFNTYLSDDHVLIPLYAGCRINFSTNKLITSYVTFEAGYSHLSYNSYDIKKEINIETGEVVAYNADISTKKEITENLFGVGAGIGLSHPVTKNMCAVLAFKLNSNLNSKNYDFLSSKETYTSINLGINFGI